MLVWEFNFACYTDNLYVISPVGHQWCSWSTHNYMSTWVSCCYWLKVRVTNAPHNYMSTWVNCCYRLKVWVTNAPHNYLSTWVNRFCWLTLRAANTSCCWLKQMTMVEVYSSFWRALRELSNRVFFCI